MSERTRKRAFAVALLAIAAATALLLLLGSPGRSGDEGADRAGPARPGRIVIVPPSAPRRRVDRQRGEEAVEPGAARGRDLSEARAVAARFAVAYLARDRGRMTAATRRTLRATTTSSLWAQLREPVRVTPAWRPTRARSEGVSGLSETPRGATLEATIAYRRAGRRRFLSVTLARTGERWRARRVGH